MASSRLSYQKLQKLPGPSPEVYDDNDNNYASLNKSLSSILQRSLTSFLKPQRVYYLRRRRANINGSASSSQKWRKPRLRVAGLLRRNAMKMISSAATKFMKRIKEGKPYIGELFAGNYMFMQVSPSPTTLKSLKGGVRHSSLLATAEAYRHYCSVRTSATTASNTDTNY